MVRLKYLLTIQSLTEFTKPSPKMQIICSFQKKLKSSPSPLKKPQTSHSAYKIKGLLFSVNVSPDSALWAWLWSHWP